MAVNTKRRRILKHIMPEGVIVTRSWLMDIEELDKHAIDNLVKSGELKVLSRGIYYRGRLDSSWQNLVYTLQSILNSDHVIGGIKALELKGFSHYISASQNQKIPLHGNDSLPSWLNNISNTISFKRHTRNELFYGMSRELSEEFTSSFFWREGFEKLKISCPERACLEMLNEVPENISFEYADQIIQGMTSLSPKVLQRLINECTNVKVNRLFFWFSSRYDYPWFSKLDNSSVNFGSGNRVLIRGGELDSKYKITVPKNF